MALAGCAADCGPDWYEIGSRDGRLGAQGQIENYARRCGTAPDATRYAEGYRAGFAQRPIPNW
ncbi:MAG: hypothetical protein K0R40_1374 [Burkholderiales bacterium]|jgi:hypothetical protein|nr:hypothetical protein [Burkholderiales bacterium]